MTASPSSSPDRRLIPSGRRVAGRLTVPGSKSVTHRYLNLALLARASHPLILERPLLAEDTRLFLAALAKAGFAVEEVSGGVEGVRLTSGSRPVPEGEEIEIFCGNAGTMLRFLVATL